MSDLFLLSVVMGKATVFPPISLEPLWISSHVSRRWFDLIILHAHVCNSRTLSRHSDSSERTSFHILKGFGRMCASGAGH